VATKIVQSKITARDYDPEAIRGHDVEPEKEANSVEDRANNWRETKL
jgi:hypothetical protein